MHNSRRADAVMEVRPVVPEHTQSRLQAIDEGLSHSCQRRRVPFPLLQSFNGAVKLAGSVAAILLIGVMALLLSSCLSQTQQAKSPEAPVAKSQLGKIAFVRAGDIWVKELPDGEAKRLTHDGRNSEPHWSPSGEWLAFRKETTSWVIRASGADAHQIQGNFSSWSPVADRLAYVTAAGLFTINADGSDPRELAKSTGGTQVGGPAWSPDGNWFAFEKTEQPANQPRNAQGQTPWAPTAQDLWRMRADGSEIKEVYRSPNPVESESWLVDWSPDGQFLLFWSGMRHSNSVSADGLPLMRVPAIGGTPVQITRMMLPNRDFLDWSPDGRRLAFVDGGDRVSWDNKRIAVADGSGAVRVLSERGRADLFPAWSPDGSRIAYASGPAALGVGGGDEAKQAMAQRHIWVMASDGSGKRELTDDPAYRDERPRWSRDGAFILFARLKDERVQVWMMRADGSEQRLVADDLSLPETGSASPPIWFAFYGNIGWGQFYDWWSGKPAAKSTAIQPAPAATRDSQIAATPVAQMPIADEDRVWGLVARSVQDVTPVLRPQSTALRFEFVQMRNVGQGTFWVDYYGLGKRVGIGAGGFNPPIVTPESGGEQRRVTVRGQAATLQIKNKAQPSELVQLYWDEPGKWIPGPGAPTKDHVFYMIGAEGLDPDAVLRLANSLREVGQRIEPIPAQAMGWKTYSSPTYGVILRYPPSWERDPRYSLPDSYRYGGTDGFFMLSASNANTIDEAAQFEANHKLRPYGSNPTVTKTQVQGQDARLIMPSDDQAPEMENQAALIVVYPEPVQIAGTSYKYLVLWADKGHIQTIASTLRFGTNG